jgi:hypothetical protein
VAQYVKKPIVVSAEQLTLHGPIPAGVSYHPSRGFHVETLEGVMQVGLGAYVITGVKGEKYPCRKDVFEETYEGVT